MKREGLNPGLPRLAFLRPPRANDPRLPPRSRREGTRLRASPTSLARLHHVHHVNWTVPEINNSINCPGDESPGAAPIFMTTPRENPLREEDKLVSV